MKSHPLLLGHRGASRYAPENTLASFDLALAHGCDGFEFDVRYTGDARAVICHDPKIDGKPIHASAYHELWADAAHGVRLPCAEEVIRSYAPRAFLDIELKVAGAIGAVLAALEGAPASARFVVSSFLPQVLGEVHARVQGVPLGLICETSAQLKRWHALPVSAVVAHWRLARRSLIDELHQAKKKIFVWTVNEEPQMRRFAELGVDALISDDTKLLAGAFQQR